jgi:hypothetical protein
MSQAQNLTWTNYKWSVVERSIVLNGTVAKLRVGFDDLSGKWFWMMGIPGEFLTGFPGKSGSFDAETEDEAVAKALRLAKKWGAQF